MMIRNLKVLGLAILAIAALSAVSASGASAAEFHSELTSTYIHGVQAEENVFTVNSRTVKCTGTTFSGTATGTSTPELTITPVYTGCTAFGLAAEVKMNGCDYLFTVSSATSGPVHVKCPAGAKIEVLTSSCTVTLSEQTPEGTVDYTNQGAGTSRDVLVTSTVNPTAVVTGSTLVCGTNGTRPSTYRGTVTTKGYTNSGMGTQVGIWEGQNWL